MNLPKFAKFYSLKDKGEVLVNIIHIKQILTHTEYSSVLILTNDVKILVRGSADETAEILNNIICNN
ncbi:MAG: hypothetical protein NTZ33_06400 [Bacteroidetes bacterium]|nr:hypothetical protein [Bacteroidota bacterium]